MPSPIRPTLFLGLGSTGVNIIAQLHELVMEAYSSFLDDRGLETFPIFKYIACDTDENSLSNQNIPPWMQMEVEFCSLGVDDVPGICQDYEGQDLRKLRPWLDWETLHLAPSQIVQGTGRVRKQGRLCLWENLNGMPGKISLHSALTRARRNMTQGDRIAAATNIVQDFYKAATGDDWPDDAGPPVNLPSRVFVVGTLCGGTGSSTFADIAQLVRNVFGLRGAGGQTMVQGIFTIPDGTGIHTAAGVKQREIANAWASLLEMDFYMDNRFDYHADLPIQEIGPTPDPPFDYVYLLSCTNEEGENIAHDGANQDVATSLNHMIATNLLAESLVGLFDRKEAIRVTYTGLGNWMKPNQQEHLAAFASFGMASYWYPRYRIANAAACHAAEEGVLAEWIARPSPNAVNGIVADAALTWKRVWRARKEGLAAQERANVQNRLGTQQAQLLSATAQQFREALKNELTELDTDNYYDNRIEQRLDGFKADIASDLRAAVRERINSHRNIALAQEYVRSLQACIRSTLEGVQNVSVSARMKPELSEHCPWQCPREYPKAPWAIMARAECSVDFWNKSVALGAKAFQQLRSDLLVEFENALVRGIAKIRNYRARPVLEDIANNVLDALNSELSAMANAVIQTGQHLNQQAGQYSTPPRRTQDTRIVYRIGSMKEDVADAKEKLRGWIEGNSEAYLSAVCEQRDNSRQEFYLLLSQVRNARAGNNTDELRSIVQRLIKPLRQQALRDTDICDLDVAKWVLANEKKAQLGHHARKAAPHLELVGPFHNVGGGAALDFIAGGSAAIDKIQTDVASQTQFIGTVPSAELRHLVLFYKERGLLEIDRNLANADAFQTNYGQVLQDKGELPLHTELSPDAFDKKFQQRKRQARALQKVSLSLLAQRDEHGRWVESDLYEVTPRHALDLRLKDANGLEIRLNGTESDIPKIARTSYIFDQYRERIDSIINGLKKEDPSAIVERRNAYADRIAQEAETQRNDPTEAADTAAQELDPILVDHGWMEGGAEGYLRKE